MWEYLNETVGRMAADEWDAKQYCGECEDAGERSDHAPTTAGPHGEEARRERVGFYEEGPVYKDLG